MRLIGVARSLDHGAGSEGSSSDDASNARIRHEASTLCDAVQVVGIASTGLVATAGRRVREA